MDSKHTKTSTTHEGAATYWGEKAEPYFELEHHSLAKCLYPAIQNIVAHRLKTGIRILDYGCGDGRLAAMLSKENQVSIYDKSSLSRELAKKRMANSPANVFEEAGKIPAGGFDVVICSMLLVCLPTISEFKSVVGSVRRVTAQGGHAIFATTHPAFRDRTFSDFLTQYTASSCQFNYFDEAKPFKVTMFNPDGSKTADIEDYHWTLATTINTIAKEGFRIERIEEPRDVPSASGGNADVPPFLIVLASLPRAILKPHDV